METDRANINSNSAYNITGPSLTPRQTAVDIRRHIPGFDITYRPDFRQDIAESWPSSIDDSELRTSIVWKPRFGLQQITDMMITEIRKKVIDN
jgi:nucleoside-diphosphate-sugar epimerase